MTKQEINIIYENLKNGFIYCSKDNFRGFYIKYQAKTKYYIIRYNNYGSSAIRFNKTNLKWLIETIFENDISNLQPNKNGSIYY